MAWIRRHLLLFAALAVLLYMLIPNIVVAVFSFNNPTGRYNYTWTEFSLDAWLNPCGAQGICESLGLSLQIGLVASLAAAALGTMVAFALGRYRFRGRSGTNLLIFMPMATPEVVMGSSLLTLFLMMGVPSGQMAVTIAHIMFCISFVVVTIRARISGFNRSLEEAAMDLGADEWTTFRKVTLPLIFPGIMAAALLSFALSIDDYVSTSFVSGQTTTFPLWVFGASRFGVPPEVNVLGTLIFVVAGVAILAQILWQRRGARQAAA